MGKAFKQNKHFLPKMGRGEQMKFAFRKKTQQGTNHPVFTCNNPFLVFWLGLLLDRSTTGEG